MIRQAISCDICGTEKRQTNHWFVAYEQSGELRVSGWTSRHRLRAESKHLCGQTCLHKLVDEFMAKSIASRTRPHEEDPAEPIVTPNDTSLTSVEVHREIESSARLIAPSSPPATLHPLSGLTAPPSREQPLHLDPPLSDPPRYGSRTWHAEAWQRERERELSAIDNHPDISARRRSSTHSRA